jgi:hypothetical protein
MGLAVAQTMGYANKRPQPSQVWYFILYVLHVPSVENDLASQAFTRLLILKVIDGIARFVFGELAEEVRIITSLGSVLNNDFPVIVYNMGRNTVRSVIDNEGRGEVR